MGLNIDTPNIYDVLTKNTKDYLSEYWQSWLGTFVQTVIQKFMFWKVVTVNQNMQVTNGYIANGPAKVVLTLPTSSDVGDIIETAALNAAGWQIAQNAGQQIQVRNTATTAGTAGSLSSTAIGDAARIVCTVENTSWLLLSHEGTLTVV